ncbi:flavin reductase [Pseudoduganella namucuonensis]|uniref:4-hydroxyphenylacetate 3-monooxygenase reductase component n=1 Tax=Pseudoduganella namucuonensis TaxID=1035707 RepID=A0A1I7LP17_9BURK|nr:flavin reductase [Pseudoduganella namucuonensis]SFV11432.1 4-hydroxyphenylacetate 3-monooxygenase reductase component [Pseudoduganella namucuonensis]
MTTQTNDTNALRQRFRDAMANLPAAVNIVTTAGPAGRCGITATAVCSVSDTPPTLLFCVNRNSSTVSAFEQNQRLCINVLPGECDELAKHFAGMSGLSMEQRFGEASWLEDGGADGDGLPRLAPALVRLAGRIVEVTRVGTHAVIFAEIDDIAIRGDADALVYFDRTFRRISRSVECGAA